MRLAELVFLFLLFLVSSVPVIAQSPNGTINGLVAVRPARVIDEVTIADRE